MSHTKSFDKPLFVTTFVLLAFGLMMIASAGIVYAETRYGDDYFFLKRQLIGFTAGLGALYFFSKVDYRKLQRLSVLLFMISLFFLILVFVPGIGTKAYGASRWIDAGPINFQPSEMFKFSLILYLAAWFSTRGQKKIRDFFEGFLPFLVIFGIAGFLILKQPDIGTLGVISIISIIMYFVSGARLSHLIYLFLSCIVFFGILIKIAPYRMNRLLVFLDPTTDPQGIGYQINQALIAIGSGGLFGLGLGHSRQKFNYLPEPAGDSIFAIIGEELGLVGITIVIILFLYFAYRSLYIAHKAPDEFGRLVAVGITSWIIFQAFMNMGAISGVLPLTGIPLPFISYGGTSLVFIMAAVGVLLNISKHIRIKR